jgi:hypothetical protein
MITYEFFFTKLDRNKIISVKNKREKEHEHFILFFSGISVNILVLIVIVVSRVKSTIINVKKI